MGVRSRITSKPVAAVSNALPPTAGGGPTRSSNTSMATRQLRKEERRAEKLAQMRSQIADGTLVVRQMTVSEQKAASKAASTSRARNETRRKLNGQLQQTRARFG